MGYGVFDVDGLVEHWGMWESDMGAGGGGAGGCGRRCTIMKKTSSLLNSYKYEDATLTQHLQTYKYIDAYSVVELLQVTRYCTAIAHVLLPVAAPGVVCSRAV